MSTKKQKHVKGSMNPEEPILSEVVEDVDIFAWANNVIQYIDDIKIEVYLFNKNHTVYRAKLDSSIRNTLRGLFVDHIVEYVLDGSEQGMIVRAFEEAESEKGVLQKTNVKNVEKLAYTLNWIDNEQHNIETFIHEEHDIKRIKGIIAHAYHPEMKQSFYVIKNLPGAQVISSPSGWLMKQGVFSALAEISAVKIPLDNQLLVVGGQLFVFNQPKLKSLFGYDAKASAIAQKVVDQIEQKFRLSFDGDASIQAMALGKPSLIKKLQKIDVDAVDQEALLRHAEDIGVELLVDDSGSIIIMDDKDLSKFVNLLNDDYVESSLTGQRYEIFNKRILKQSSSDAV